MEEPQEVPADEEHERVWERVAAIDVARILEFFRPCDRILLQQQYMNGVTTEEIAKEQGVTETAIRIRLLRARRDARSKVEQRTSPIPARRAA